MRHQTESCDWMKSLILITLCGRTFSQSWTWTFTADYYIPGLNVGSQGQVSSLEECRLICEASLDPCCLSLDYHTANENCFLNGVTAKDASLKKDKDLDYYERVPANCEVPVITTVPSADPNTTPTTLPDPPITNLSTVSIHSAITATPIQPDTSDPTTDLTASDAPTKWLVSSLSSTPHGTTDLTASDAPTERLVSSPSSTPYETTDLTASDATTERLVSSPSSTPYETTDLTASDAPTERLVSSLSSTPHETTDLTASDAPTERLESSRSSTPHETTDLTASDAPTERLASSLGSTPHETTDLTASDATTEPLESSRSSTLQTILDTTASSELPEVTTELALAETTAPSAMFEAQSVTASIIRQPRDDGGDSEEVGTLVIGTVSILCVAAFYLLIFLSDIRHLIKDFRRFGPFH